VICFKCAGPGAKRIHYRGASLDFYFEGIPERDLGHTVYLCDGCRARRPSVAT
jgi:hypothetical protein